MKTKLQLIFWIFISILFFSCNRIDRPIIKDVKLTYKFTMGPQQARSYSDSLCILIVELTNISAASIDSLKSEELYVDDGNSKYHETFRMTMKGDKEWIYMLFSVPKEIRNPHLFIKGYPMLKLKTENKIYDEINLKDLK